MMSSRLQTKFGLYKRRLRQNSSLTEPISTMKVFQVTLLIVGLVGLAASSTPRSTVYDLEDRLREDIDAFRARSKLFIKTVFVHLQVDVPAFLESPFIAADTLIIHVTTDAQEFIDSAYSNLGTMKYHIQLAINELTPADLVLKGVLDVLTQELDEAGREAVLKKDQLLQLISSHAFADAKEVIALGPAAASDIVMAHVNDDFNLFVRDLKDFIRKIQTVVKETNAKLEKLVSG
ncbi:unnamed protein product [Nezara viridula]|uniref:Uncharacterized protein n=1 Tax=Nezara viridula TaxID=85310 RepID=A0A9P0MHE2_NEZVI|nr:unnamed protein product [Nezara viridula]